MAHEASQEPGARSQEPGARSPTTRRVGAVAVLLLLTVLIGSCEQPLPSDSDEPTATASDEVMTNAGIERSIPLTFYKLYAASDPELWLRIRQSVVVANMMFKAAGIQFHIARVKDCATNGEFADVSGSRWSDEIAYQVAFPALECAFGNLPQPPQLPPVGGYQGRVWWLDYATLNYGRDNEIVVWLHPSMTVAPNS